MYPRFNVVGCGRLGQAIATLFRVARIADEIHVCNRSLESGERAVAAIGGGVAHSSISSMPISNLWLVACGDQEIERVAELIAADGALMADAVVFHCSGFLSSDVLRVVKGKGAHVASAHPVRSFANVEMAVREFPGTFCGVEGENPARKIVSDIFTELGARVFPLSPEGKVLCHAGHVFASNYVVALLTCARDLYRAAEIPDELAWQLMAPLVRGTIDNVMGLGPARALTGPIARGEEVVVAKQADVVSEASALVADLYVKLGLVAVDIAREQGLPSERCHVLRRVLRDGSRSSQSPIE